MKTAFGQVRDKLGCSGLSLALRLTAMALVLSVVDLALAAAQSTNAPPKLPPPPDFSSFRIVNDRNIFNASRSGQQRRTERRRPNRVDSFSLVGIIEYEKGRFAFFDGSSPEYRKTVKQKGTIANHTVLEIAPDRVKLAYGTNKVTELRVGMQVRREEEGEWILGDFGESYAGSGQDAAAPSSGVSGKSEPGQAAEFDDVVRKLMEQREKETK